MGNKTFGVISVSGVAFSVGCFVSTMASAQSLPAAQYSGFYSLSVIGQTNITGPGNYPGSYSDPHGYSSVTTNLDISPYPAPSITFDSAESIATQMLVGIGEDTEGSINFGPKGRSFLTYSIEFVGPSGLVPVQVNALVNAAETAQMPDVTAAVLYADVSVAPASAGTGAAPGFSDYVYMFDGAGSINLYDGTSLPLNGGASTGLSGSVTDSHIWLAQTNTVYTVGLGLWSNYGMVGTPSGGTLSQSALVDPTFAISSMASNPSQYSILLSSGIGNSVVAAVPEPSSFALIVAGLAIVGGAARLRRTKAGSLVVPG